MNNEQSTAAVESVASMQNVIMEVGGKIILNDLTFDVKKGEKFFIMGGDASGKTTVMKILTGLLNFQKGDVRVFGRHINVLSRKELVEVRKRLGFVFQGGGLAASLTIMENLVLPLRYHAVYSEALIPNIAEELLAMVGMQDYCDYFPVDLNLAMKKKVGIARALAMNPELILYDDPSIDMVGLARRKLEEHIIWLHEKLGITSIIVSTNIEFAKREADRVMIMCNGKALAIGTVHDLTTGSDEKIKNFMVTGNLARIF